MPIPLPPRSRPLLRAYIARPWLAPARVSPAARRYCDRHGYITPHFTWASYACKDGTHVPHALEANAVRLHWRLELLRHRLGDQAMTVNGPYRTPHWNRVTGGAGDSRHVHADAADFFRAQIKQWATGIRRHGETLDHALARVLGLASRTFYNGGVGNEPNGTLHVDTRGRKVRFVTWTPGR